MLHSLIWLLFVSQPAQAQDAQFPLESVVLEGTALKRDVILEIAGLRLGAPVDKPMIESACSKLQESGLFDSLTYRYAPGPKRGFVLTLTIADKTSLSDASIDLP